MQPTGKPSVLGVDVGQQRNVCTCAAAVLGFASTIGILPPVRTSASLSRELSDIPFIKINDKYFNENMELCKFSLIVKVF